MPTNTLLIQGRTSLNAATLIVAAGDGPTLINNNGPNTLYVGDTDSIASTDGYGITSIAAGGFFSVDGEHDLYATIASGLPTTISLIRGGLNFFSLTKLIILSTGGVGTGFFVYSGVPGLGNPPIFAVVAPGQTQDPFGNPVSAVLNIGNISAAFIGWDANGNTFIHDTANKVRLLIASGAGGVWAGGTDPAVVFFNSFGAVILVVDPQRGGTFQYQDNNSAVQGVLIGAQVGKNTTDPINGTTVNAGVNLIDPAFGDSIIIVGANITIIQALFTRNMIVTANTGSGVTSPFAHIGAPEQGHAGHAVLRLYGVSADGTVTSGAIISRTDPPVRASNALLELQGELAMQGIALPSTPPAGYAKLVADANAFFEVMAGDGNNYDIERLTVVLAADFTINSTAAQVILSHAVGIGTYEIEIWAVVNNNVTGAAGEAIFQVLGPAAAAKPQLVDFETKTTGTATVGYGANATNYSATFPDQGVNVPQQVKMNLTVKFTAAGTVQFTGKETTAGDTITVFAGTRMRICPVSAT